MEVNFRPSDRYFIGRRDRYDGDYYGYRRPYSSYYRTAGVKSSEDKIVTGQELPTETKI